MKIHFFGTCAGTEPMPGRKHVSFAVEKDGELYWFDAGEGCSYTAHLMGVDLLSVHNIFISHSHMDHVGGLGNLLWNIRKINNVSEIKRMDGKKIDVYMANKTSWDGIMQMLRQTEGGFQTDFDVNWKDISDGILYDQDGMRVTALHNTHLGIPEDGQWMSYSFLIEAEGKRIVFSGDLGDIGDIDSLTDQCDLLLIETGHFAPEYVCNYIKDNDKKVKTLGFIHSGRHILENAELELSKAKEILGDGVFIAEDGMTIDI